MAKLLGIEYLPYEVLEVMVTYLPAEDLTHCLSVSRAWYNIFSNDMFWKRYCKTKDDYLSKTKYVVEPCFKPPAKPYLPIQKYRLQFLQEQHIWGNWDSGRFKREEIVFDCDDSMSYNIEVSFLDNDHLCLHRTSETQVWNVAETPFLVMTIPYCLKEMWEDNIYQVIDNNLVVIQCIVVQVYNICLGSKNWSLNRVFFFNKPEEFSSSITAETDVNALFQLEYNRVGTHFETHFERIICGQYLVGAYEEEESPILHIWDIKTGKKVIKETCDICKETLNCNSKFSFVELEAPEKIGNRVLVIFNLIRPDPVGSEPVGDLPSKCSVVYDLSQLQFLLPTMRYHSENILYFDRFLSVIEDEYSVKIYQYQNHSAKDKTKYPSTICLQRTMKHIHSVQPIGSSLLMANRRELFMINKTEEKTPNSENISLLKVGFRLFHMVALFDRYALLHDVDYESIKEVWKVPVGKSPKKVMEFPSDSGTYAARNNVCSKIVLEHANKLIVLNFW